MKSFIAGIILFLSGSSCFAQQPSIDLQTRRLAVLCKVWGVLKFYHPGIQQGKPDCDTILISIIPKIIGAKDDMEFNNLIFDFISLPGPVEKLSKPFKYLPKDTTINNLDFAWINNDMFIEKRSGALLRQIIENYRPCTNVAFKKEFDVVYECGNISKVMGAITEYPDETKSLFALFKYWNTINYFDPHKKSLDENWDNVLMEYIPKFRAAAESKSFYLTLAQLTTEINDCHAYYENPILENEYGPVKSACHGSYKLFKVLLIDGSTVIYKITDSLSAKTNLHPGDILLSIDGKKVSEKRKELEKICGCSTVESVNREVNNALMFVKTDHKTNTDIEVMDSIGNIKKVSIPAQLGNCYYDISHPIREIDNSIEYVNLESATGKEIRKTMKNCRKKLGLIFDLRGNSNATLIALEFRLPFHNRKNIFNRYYSVNLKYPGTFTYNHQPVFYLGLKTFFRKYKGKVVFLINENVQSTFEYQLMSLKASYDITLVGSNTCGSDGRAFSYLVTDDFVTYFTADMIQYPDGSPTQRVGIKPDVYVKPTISGIRKNKDEVLNRAVDFINTGK